jgi:hypothetical protein
MSRYSAYGLTIDANEPLPGAPPTSAPRADLTIDFRSGADPQVDPEAAITTDRRGWYSTTALAGGGRVYRLAAEGGARAWSMEVSANGRRIEVRWTAATELADVIAFVMTRGIAASLACRGVPLLHACAIGLGAGAALVAGPTGAGKSTVAAAAVAGGAALLADDISALVVREGRIHVEPGVHRLRLDSDVAQALGWDPDGLPRVFADPLLTDKRCVELSGAQGSFCDEPRPLAAVYVLGERVPDGPRLARVSPTDALPLLLTNAYGSDLMDRPTKAELLSFWARLAQEVPVSRVHAPDDLAGLPALLAALETDCRSSHSASSTIPSSKLTSGR